MGKKNEKRSKENNERYALSRKQYLAIKSYDHTQMETALGRVYQEGIEEGKGMVKVPKQQEPIHSVTKEQILKVIANTPGIGIIKQRAIENNLDTLFR